MDLEGDNQNCRGWSNLIGILNTFYIKFTPFRLHNNFIFVGSNKCVSTCPRWDRFKVVLPRGSMTFSKNEIWTGYFTSSAKNILEKVRNWKLCVFLLVIVWKTMIFQHKTIAKSMGKSMKSWFFTKIHKKWRFQKKYFFDRFFYIL